MTAPPPAAVLWDMDGTLVDTEPLWIAAERRLVEGHGGSWSEADSLALVCSDLLAAGEYIRGVGGLPMTAAEIVAHLVAEVLRGIRRGVVWRPGARTLLAGLSAAGIPAAMVTMSYRVLADAVVVELPAGTFGAVITGDEVANGKPNPEPYLTAAASLGVDPRECVVFEDSATGLSAGMAAGARWWAFRMPCPLSARPGSPSSTRWKTLPPRTCSRCSTADRTTSRRPDAHE